MKVVAVTGANGFVGSALMSALPQYDCEPRGLLRYPPTEELVAVGDIGPDTEWGEALSGIDTVIHCAARVHVMKDDAADPLADGRLVVLDMARRERRAHEAA